jgi:hypothetical protein
MQQVKSQKLSTSTPTSVIYKPIQDLTKPHVTDIEQSIIEQHKMSQKIMLYIKKFIEKTCIKTKLDLTETVMVLYVEKYHIHNNIAYVMNKFKQFITQNMLYTHHFSSVKNHTFHTPTPLLYPLLSPS